MKGPGRVPAVLLALAIGASPSRPLGAAGAAGAVPGGAVYAVLTAPSGSVPAPCRGAPAGDGAVRLPLFSEQAGQCPVARIGADAILLRDLADALTAMHEERAATREAPETSAMELGPALERLVETRLIAREAEEMRLTELPEVRRPLEAFEATTARAILEREVTARVEPEALEVERLYDEATREWTVTSLLFGKAEDASAFQEGLAAGTSFDALAERAVAEGKVKGDRAPQRVLRRELVPEIRAALDRLAVGAVSPTVQIPSGRVVLRVEAVGRRDDPAAREEARRRSLALQQREALRGYHQALAKKHAKVDRALLDRIDLEAEKPGFAALARDRRALARFRGAEPITVAELASAVAERFFHGMEKPIREHRVNPQKAGTFEALLTTRVLAAEAAARKIPESDEYRWAVERHRRALAFDAFVRRVLLPDVVVTEQDAKAYHAEHPADYTSPQLLRLESLAFSSASAAEAALAKLRGGTDPSWLRSNAGGALQPEAASLRLDRTALVSVSTMPPALAKALTGAAAGESRLYAASGSEVHVVRVLQEVPPRLQRYEEARESIARRLQAERLRSAIRAYAARLREATPVDVLVTRVASCGGEGGAACP